MKDFFNCQECVDLLTDYLEGNLGSDLHGKLDDHLSACAPCVNFLRTFERSADLTHRLREQQVDVPDAVQQRVKSFLRDEILAMSQDREED